MQFAYGNYYHAPNSVFFKGIQRTFVRGQTGRPHLANVSWNLEGKLLGSSVQNMQGQLAQLQHAYASDNQSAVMYDNNGRPTNWIVDTTQTIGGVTVTNLVSHENVSGAHGITYLKYTFGLSWSVLWAGPQDVLSFNEVLEFHNNQGQPLTIERLPQNGPPIIQAISQSSWYYCTQSGNLTQAGPNPQPMPPLFPGNFRGQEGSNSSALTSPKTIRGVPYEYGIRWKYDYISDSPIFSGAIPNVR